MTGAPGARPLALVDIVLVRPREAGNVGMVARAIANHGLGRLILVAPRGFDPDRARWRAPGAADVVDACSIHASVQEAVAPHARVFGTSARRRSLRWPLLGPDAVAREICGQPQPTALLFGPEDAGLQNEDMAPCHKVLELPTAAHASLNLAQAVTVTASHLLLEARRQGVGPSGPSRDDRGRGGAQRRGTGPLASAALQGRLADQATQLLARSTYTQGRKPEQVRSTLVQLLGRLGPEQGQAEIMLGMLAALSWRLDHPDGADPDGAQESSGPAAKGASGRRGPNSF